MPARTPLLSAFLLTCLAGSALSAATIDYSTIDDPQAIDIPDRSAEARWRALFTLEPDWVARQIHYLSDKLPERSATLLVARLLYRGEPWVRRSGDQTNAKRWKLSDTDTKLALLREIRANRDPVLGDALKHFLALETDSSLLRSGLATLWCLDPKSAPEFAVRLADPRPGNKLPGAAVPAVRLDALRLLMSIKGPDAPETRRALEWALLQSQGGERNHALSLLKRGTAPDLVQAAILRFNNERAKGEVDDDASAGLAIACSRIGNDIDAKLATALVEIAVNGDREIAAPAATALASNLTWSATVPVNEIAKRSATATDPVIRHALLNLLLRVNTKAGDIDRPGSAWNALSAHRERLSRWEWEQYVR